LRGGREKPWASLRSPFLAALLLLACVVAAAGMRSHQQLATAREHERALSTEIRATRERIAALERRVDRLRDDDATLERVAREDLGLVEPGDVVLVLPPGVP
jgi:cell division protein FtsB